MNSDLFLSLRNKEKRQSALNPVKTLGGNPMEFCTYQRLLMENDLSVITNCLAKLFLSLRRPRVNEHYYSNTAHSVSLYS
jgi:hypothetical protein